MEATGNPDQWVQSVRLGVLYCLDGDKTQCLRFLDLATTQFDRRTPLLITPECAKEV